MLKGVRRVAEAVMAEREGRIEYLVGTKIELPRAALRAGLPKPPVNRP